jgi:hypothetical protein
MGAGPDGPRHAGATGLTRGPVGGRVIFGVLTVMVIAGNCGVIAGGQNPLPVTRRQGFSALLGFGRTADPHVSNFVGEGVFVGVSRRQERYTLGVFNTCIASLHHSGL